MKDYEISYLVKEEDSSGIQSILEKNQAVVEDESSLQKTQTAYAIKKQPLSYMGSLRFQAEPESLPQIETALKLDNNLLRHLIIKVTKKQKKGRGVSAPSASREKPELRRAEPTVRPEREEILTNEALEKKIEEIMQ